MNGMPFNDAPDHHHLPQHKDTAWLRARGGPTVLASLLHVEPQHGLRIKGDITPAHREAAYGANRFQEIPPKGFLYLWYKAIVGDPIVLLLIAAATISTIIGVAVPAEREEQAWTEGVAIWVAVLVVTLVWVHIHTPQCAHMDAQVSAVQDWHKNRQFAKLNKQNNAIDVKVLRDGTEQLLPNTEVVVGDVLLLEAGDKVVADGVYLHGYDLVIDESSLTGESEPIKKGTDDPWCRRSVMGAL